MLRTNSMNSCRTIQTRLIISSAYVFYCESSLSVSRWKRKSPLSGTSIGIWLVTVSRKLSLRYSGVAFTSSCGNEAFINSALFTKGTFKRSPTFHARCRSPGDLSGLSILERIGLYKSGWSQAIYSILAISVAIASLER